MDAVKGVKDERVPERADRMLCGQGKHSIGKIRVNNGDMYYFSMLDCADCPRKDECLTPVERKGKAMARRILGEGKRRGRRPRCEWAAEEVLDPGSADRGALTRIPIQMVKAPDLLPARRFLSGPRVIC